MMKSLTYIICLCFSQTLFACCGDVNFNLFSLLHFKEAKYSAFMVRADSSVLMAEQNFMSYVTVVESYSNPNLPKHIEIYSGGNNTAGGSFLQAGKYYFVVGHEFEPNKFSGFVCDGHSRQLSNNEDSSMIVTKMLQYKKHTEQKFTGKVKYFNDTVLIAEGYLKKGIPNGRWKYYNWEGKLLEDIKCKMGKKTEFGKRYNITYTPHISVMATRKRSVSSYTYNSETGVKTLIATQKYDKNGNMTNRGESYHENGRLKQKSTSFQYQKGHFSSPYFGNHEEYAENGKIIGKGKYDCGAKVGKWLELNTVDSTVQTKFYPKIKKQKGIFTWYYANGVKECDYVFKENENDGTWTWYYENGTIRCFGNYKNGKSQGVWKSFDKKNRLEEERTYVDDEENGLLINYYPESGKIESEVTYKNGSFHGTYKSYHTNGNLSSTANYNEKGQHGQRTIFTKDGKIILNINYINNHIDGTYILYDENAEKIIEKGTYNNGTRIGEWLSYYKSGKLKERCIYPAKLQMDVREKCEYFDE